MRYFRSRLLLSYAGPRGTIALLPAVRRRSRTSSRGNPIRLARRAIDSTGDRDRGPPQEITRVERRPYRRWKETWINMFLHVRRGGKQHDACDTASHWYIRNMAENTLACFILKRIQYPAHKGIVFHYRG